MRELDRGDEFNVTRIGSQGGELAAIRRRQFVPREVVVAAFAHIPPIDLKEFRAESDAYIDPTPREWFEL
jgi:hypothetical protein